MDTLTMNNAQATKKDPTKLDLSQVIMHPERQLDWRAMEEAAILEALRRCNGSTAKAAKLLGFSTRKVQYRLKDMRDLAALRKVA